VEVGASPIQPHVSTAAEACDGLVDECSSGVVKGRDQCRRNSLAARFHARGCRGPYAGLTRQSALADSKQGPRRPRRRNLKGGPIVCATDLYPHHHRAVDQLLSEQIRPVAETPSGSRRAKHD
jgi:hypothetical protein